MSCASVLPAMTDNASQDTRHHEIQAWLALQGLDVEHFRELTGDVSLRRYVRLTSGGTSTILAVYPPEIRAACRNFLATTRLLSQAGVRVPRILASDCGQGLTLLEDVGSATLYDLRDTVGSGLAGYFWQAITDVERIQSIAVEKVAPLNPPLDRDLLWRELTQTWSSLFEPHGLCTDPGFSRVFEATLREVCRLLDTESPVPCHRDFMSRNFVPVEPQPELAVLDHQDLRLGPRHYDLASLLNDSLFPSEALEEEILDHCLSAEPAERISYHRAAAQRTLKATGTYETFAQRGYPRHRKLIPETLQRAVRHLGHLPEATEIRSDLEKRMAPLLIC